MIFLTSFYNLETCCHFIKYNKFWLFMFLLACDIELKRSNESFHNSIWGQVDHFSYYSGEKTILKAFMWRVWNKYTPIRKNVIIHIYSLATPRLKSVVIYIYITFRYY